MQDFAPIPSGGEQFSLAFMERYGLVKLRDGKGEFIVGAAWEPDPELVRTLVFAEGREPKFVAIAKNEFSEFLTRYAADLGTDVRSERVSDENLLDRLANDAPVVNLVNSILLEGLRLGCSDIHLEGSAEGLRVRFRIDGMLTVARTLPKDIGPSLSSRIKIMSNLNIIERRLPQDGKMNALVDSRPVEFRVSIMPTIEGESIVLRLFNREGGFWSLDELGFGERFIAKLRDLMRFPHGLILVTGPTGSGKTTTLNAIMRELNSPEVKILTVEDPVENRLSGVCQVQTNDEIGMSFDSILRRLLRQDPDILMIGEVRDKATADIALRSALTGHQVWATLHTNDALSAVTRLVNMGLEPYLLAGVVRGVMAQRLVRKLCPLCSAKRRPEPAESSFLEAQGLSLTEVPYAVGCQACNRGYKGRTAIGEIFAFDDDAEEIVLRGGGHRELTDHYARLEEPFLADAGLHLVREGVTTIAELERVIYGL
jgi:type II secretory ATPase GspE/PulE/Tfp pilus assembly ATPase PilB-like protein